MTKAELTVETAKRRQFSLRGMFIAISLTSLHLAALGAIVRSGGSHGVRIVVLLVGVIVCGAVFGAASTRRSAMFRSGLPFAQLAVPRPRSIRLWQSAAIPLVVLCLARYIEAEGQDFPFLLLVCTVVVAVSAVSVLSVMRYRTLAICENGIVAESKFVPWRTFERAGWNIDQDGLLKLGSGFGQYEAVIPIEQRPAVEEFLQHKLGEPRHN